MKKSNLHKKVIRIPLLFATTIIGIGVVLTNREKIDVQIKGLVEMKASYSLVEANTYDISEEGNGSIIATLSEDGVLTISGTGKMKKWNSSSEVPWYETKEQIKQVKK